MTERNFTRLAHFAGDCLTGLISVLILGSIIAGVVHFTSTKQRGNSSGERELVRSEHESFDTSSSEESSSISENIEANEEGQIVNPEAQVSENLPMIKTVNDYRTEFRTVVIRNGQIVVDKTAYGPGTVTTTYQQMGR